MDDPANGATPPARSPSGLRRVLRAVDPRFVALYFIALVPRLAVYPLFRHLIAGGDEVYYWRQATRPFFIRQLRPPLWPLFLRLPRLFSDDVVAGRLLAVAVGALLAPLLFLLVRRLFDARAAWTAALIAAFYPDHVMWSHFLWTESFVSVLLVASCLAIFPRDASAPLRPLAGGLALGITLLAKEYALMAFAAMAVTFLVVSDAKWWRRVRLLALSFVLLLLPTALFTAGVFVSTGKLKAPLAAAFGNARQAADLGFSIEEGALDEYVGTLAQGSGAALTNVREDMQRLWGARSFVLWRLSREHYGVAVSHALIMSMVLVHAAIMIAGLIGLVCEPNRRFQIFAFGCIGFLSLAAVPGFMVSRFRTPFVFLFIIGAARLLTEPDLVRKGLKSPVRATACLVGTGLLAALFLTTYQKVRWWG